MDEEKRQRALEVYGTLCDMLDRNEWNYQKDDENLTISCGARGDDLPMDITIRVIDKVEIIMLQSRLPFVISEDARLDTAIAVSIVNNRLVSGCFDYNLQTGNMSFRMTSSYRESVIGAESLNYMLKVSCYTIDEYNDKFLMLSKGLISFQDFLPKE